MAYNDIQLLEGHYITNDSLYKFIYESSADFYKQELVYRKNLMTYWSDSNVDSCVNHYENKEQEKGSNQQERLLQQAS
jgi:hypothetical protein